MMKTGRLVRGVVISLAAFGICIPPVALAAEPTQMPVVTDVALRDGGMLQGKVVDLQGAGVAGVPVSVQAQNREVAAATTANEGRFSIPGLKGGVYHVAAAEGHGVYRLWTAGTAPPSAQNDAIVYTQYGYGPGAMKMFFANPIVIAGLVATAIAVPIALSNAHPASP
jgi:hypothetical protein